MFTADFLQLKESSFCIIQTVLNIAVIRFSLVVTILH
jgi:hypothetical protein